MSRDSKKTSSTDVHLHHSVRYHHGSVDDVLRPGLISLDDGRCYRKLDVTFGRTAGEEFASHSTVWSASSSVQYTGDDHYDEGQGTVELDGAEPLPGDKGFRLAIDIPSVFYKYIIGRQGATKHSIEKDTNTRIKVPPRGVEGEIVIEGDTLSCLADAKRRLEIVMWSNRLKEPVTHFISIPLNHPIIMERLTEFKQQVLKTCCKDRGIGDEVFQTPAKFHLTVGVMRLFTKEEEEKAKAVLQKSIAEARECLGDETVMINLSGIESMNDDPTSVNVLYANVSLKDSSDRLQKFVDAVVEYFINNSPDLMTREFERTGVKLHATILNSKFRDLSGRKKGLAQRVAYKPPESFDATRIFKEFGNFQFGEIPLQYVHLSKRGEYGPDGFYRCIREYSIDTISCG